MKAGRELDALIAEKVMGWTGCQSDNPLTGEKGGAWGFGDAPKVVHLVYLPKFSESIADAWQVVEKLAKEGDEHPVNLHKGLPAFGDHATPFEVYKNYASYPGWTCYFRDYEVCVHAGTAPLAICLAALKACGVEVPND